MKLQVVHEDGKIEVLTVSGVWECHEGKTLDRLSQGGFDHFFTKAGHYDGWGGFVAADTTMDQAREIGLAMSQKREFK